MRVACLFFEQLQDTKSIAEIFYKASPQIMLRQNQAIFLEISRSLHLYSESSFIARAQATLKKIAIPARIAIAADVPTALATAMFNVQSAQQLPIASLLLYFDPLNENPDKHAKIKKMIEHFTQLGIHTLSDLQRISRKEISSRFGNLGLVAYLRVAGELTLPWKIFTPQESIVETFEFDLENPVDNLEPIYFALRPMIERVVLRAKAKGKRVRQFDVILKQEYALKGQNPQYVVPHILQLPHINNKIFFQISKETLERAIQLRPLQSRIVSFSILVKEEVPAKESQKDLFDPKKEESHESLFHFHSRVSTKLGEHSAFYAQLNESYLPELNWSRAQEYSAKLVKDPLAKRPLRIFAAPRKVQFTQTQLLLGSEKQEVLEVTDYEIIFSHWWRSCQERIYFQVLTKAGQRLWLFRSRQGTFLHGEFD